MANAEEKREKQLQAAAKARKLLDSLTPVRDVQARAEIIHTKIAEGIRTVCAENPQSFNAKQVSALADIAVHLFVIMDPNQKEPTSFWGKCKAEFLTFSPFGKITAIGAVFALIAGLFSFGQMAYSGAMSAWGSFSEPAVAAPEKPDATAVTKKTDRVNMPDAP